MARTTATQDRSTVTKAIAKLFMRVDITDEDAIIDLMLKAAKRKADEYMINPFLDTDGVTELDIPADVDMWVLQTVSKYYNHRTIGLHKEEILDLGAIQFEKLADVDINYDGLKLYRLEPGFGGYWV